MALQHVYAIDLGTSTIKIYDQKKDTITKNRNMIAIRNKDTVFAVGNEAYEMYERVPKDIEVVFPMANGRINDIITLEAVIQILLTEKSTFLGVNPLLYFSVPADMTEIEKRAYYSIARRGKLRKCKVFLVEKPICDALALGIPISRTKGSMVVNIGAQSTELSVLAEDRIIISKIIPIGGSHFNEAISGGIRRRNSFQISAKMAENLKISLTDLQEEKQERQKVMGIDIRNGLPRDGIVTSYTITREVRSQILRIAEEIKKFLDRTPPQVHDSILKEGIYVAGGSTEIAGIEGFLTEYLGCSVRISGYFDMCTISGLKELVNHDALQKWAFTPKKSKYYR